MNDLPLHSIRDSKAVLVFHGKSNQEHFRVVNVLNSERVAFEECLGGVWLPYAYGLFDTTPLKIVSADPSQRDLTPQQFKINGVNGVEETVRYDSILLHPWFPKLTVG
jgi:hypothetical protein